MYKIITKINNFIAVRLTLFVGSIVAFYIFCILGLIPLFYPHQEELVLYWSNYLQLVFLPVITVGATILGRKAEKRSNDNAFKISENFKMLHISVDQLLEVHKIVEDNNKQIAEILKLKNKDN